jgi:hypothetical protein
METRPRFPLDNLLKLIPKRSIISDCGIDSNINNDHSNTSHLRRDQNASNNITKSLTLNPPPIISQIRRPDSSPRHVVPEDLFGLTGKAAEIFKDWVLGIDDGSVVLEEYLVGDAEDQDEVLCPGVDQDDAFAEWLKTIGLDSPEAVLEVGPPLYVSQLFHNVH